MTIAELKRDIENLPESSEIEFYTSNGSLWVVDVSNYGGRLSIQLCGEND